MTTIETNDYTTLAEKLVELSGTLTDGENAALTQLLDHAAAHTSEVTGYQFTTPEEDEVSGYSFSFSPVSTPQFHAVAQFGSVSGGYNNQFAGIWGSQEF